MYAINLKPLELFVEKNNIFIDYFEKSYLSSFSKLSQAEKELITDEFSVQIYSIIVTCLYKYKDKLFTQDTLNVLNKMVKNFEPLQIAYLKNQLTSDNLELLNYNNQINSLIFCCMCSSKDSTFWDSINSYLKMCYEQFSEFSNNDMVFLIKLKSSIGNYLRVISNFANSTSELLYLFKNIFDLEENSPNLTEADPNKNYFVELYDILCNIGNVFFSSYNVTYPPIISNLLNTDSLESVTVTNANSNGDGNLEAAVYELNSLIGLDEVKSDVNGLINLIKVTSLRKSQGIKTPPLSLHLVFTGNPGTGKTTVARLIAKIYKALGIITKDEILEVDRAGLVAGYVGQTAIKTQEVITKALGGILFIDEAYTLSVGGDNDYGQEAINTLLKAMEDNRERLVVIVAGYTNEMKTFLNSNPGLSSRFNKYIYFPDYSPEELTEILVKMFEKNEFILSDDVVELIREICFKIFNEKDENFANARSVRNIFEKVLRNNANRVANINSPDLQDLQTVIIEDFRNTY